MDKDKWLEFVAEKHHGLASAVAAQIAGWATDTRDEFLRGSSVPTDAR